MSLLTPSFAASQTDSDIHILVRLSASHLGQAGVAALLNGPQSSEEIGSGPSSASSIGVVVQANIFGFRCAPYYLPLVFPGDLSSESSPLWRIAERGEEGTDLVVGVTLTKANEGEDFHGLDELQAQYFPDGGAGSHKSAPSLTGGVAKPPGFAGGAVSRDEETGLINQMLGRAMAKEGLTTQDETMAAPSTDGITTINAEASFSSSSSKQAPHSQTLQQRHQTTRPPRLPVVPLGTRSRCHKLFLSTDKVAAAAASSSSSSTGSGVMLEEGEGQYRAGFSERMEDEKWDEAWYLDNYVDEAGEIAELMRWEDPRGSGIALTSNGAGSDVEADGTKDVALLLVLVELLFAQAYDRRTTMGDAGVESGWTMAMLCRSLVCSCPPLISPTGDIQASLEGTLRASYRRALSMPLYRHWELAERVKQQVASTLGRGKEATQQALEDVSAVMSGAADDDQAMVIYLEHLVAPLESWLRQSVEDKSLFSLSRALAGTRITKEQVGGDTWDLEALEEAAREALAEQQQ